MYQSVDTHNVFSPATADHHNQKKIVNYMEKLRVADGHALGFLPLSVMLDAIVKDRVIVEIEFGEPTGFLFWGRNKKHLRVYMIAIQQDNRRIYHARNLMLGLFTLEQNQIAESISLRCATDLDANWFWNAVGFRKINTVEGGKLRPDLIRPRPGTDDYQVQRALGKGVLIKKIRKKSIYRMINVWHLQREQSELWAGHDKLITVDYYPSVTG